MTTAGGWATADVKDNAPGGVVLLLEQKRNIQPKENIHNQKKEETATMTILAFCLISKDLGQIWFLKFATRYAERMRLLWKCILTSEFSTTVNAGADIKLLTPAGRWIQRIVIQCAREMRNYAVEGAGKLTYGKYALMIIVNLNMIS